MPHVHMHTAHVHKHASSISISIANPIQDRVKGTVLLKTPMQSDLTLISDHLL